MAYSGFLIRVGNFEISASEYINVESYKTARKIQDLDSYRDANGLLHRNALSHVPNTVDFETCNMLTDRQMSALMAGIRSNYIDAKERKANVTFYVPELDNYVTQEMYMADPEFNMFAIFDGVIRYKPMTISFVAY